MRLLGSVWIAVGALWGLGGCVSSTDADPRHPLLQTPVEPGWDRAPLAPGAAWTDTGVSTSQTTTDPTLPALPPPGAAACAGDPATFLTDVSGCAGLGAAINLQPGTGEWLLKAATGQAFGDLDGDSWLDLLLTSPGGLTELYLGSSTGEFTLRADPGMNLVTGLGATVADLDQDGDLDVMVAGRDYDFVLDNQGGALVAIPGPSDPNVSLGASVVDADGDGILEVHTANYTCPLCSNGSTACEYTVDGWWVQGPTGWENQVDAAMHAQGVLTCGFAFIGVWGDFDNDGDPDQYVVNDRGRDQPDVEGSPVLRNTYFRNDGPGCGSACFTEVARDNGSVLYLDAMGVDAGDFDNDGDLDLAVTDAGPVTILSNDGTGQFTDVSPQLQITDPPGVSQWGVVWLDYDNDGDLDLYLGSTQQDTVWRNDGAVFVEETLAALGEDITETRGVAAADYDRDGKVDVMVGTPGGFYRLRRNTHSNQNNWLGLRLHGSGAGGTDALGARVYLTDTSGRQQMREVKSGSSNGAGSDLGLHFGLGLEDATEVRVRWPDGVEQVVLVHQNAWTEVTR